MGREGGPSPEEMGLKPEETRIVSDAELIKRGARLKEGGQLEASQRNIKDAQAEMEYEKDPKVQEYKAKMKELKAAIDAANQAWEENADVHEVGAKTDQVKQLLERAKLLVTDVLPLTQRPENKPFENDEIADFYALTKRAQEVYDKFYKPKHYNTPNQY